MSRKSLEFGQRSTEQFTFISPRDPRVLSLPQEQLIEYFDDRKPVEVLSLDECTNEHGIPEQPLMIIGEPIKPKYDHLRQHLNNPSAQKRIFALHVCEIINGLELIKINAAAKEERITDSQMEEIDPILVNEFALRCVQESTRSSDLPLPASVQGTWKVSRIQSEIRRALNARMKELVKKTNSD